MFTLVVISSAHLPPSSGVVRLGSALVFLPILPVRGRWVEAIFHSQWGHDSCSSLGRTGRVHLWQLADLPKEAPWSGVAVSLDPSWVGQ